MGSARMQFGRSLGLPRGEIGLAEASGSLAGALTATCFYLHGYCGLEGSGDVASRLDGPQVGSILGIGSRKTVWSRAEDYRLAA